MKKILFIVISLIIFIHHGSVLPVCNNFTANQAIPPRIFFETTMDGSTQNTYLTRFYHNKLGIYLSEFSRCYSNVFDPNFVYDSLGLVGLIAYFAAIYYIIVKKIWILITLALLLPLLPFLNAPVYLIIVADKIFAIIGLSFLLLRK